MQISEEGCGISNWEKILRSWKTNKPNVITKMVLQNKYKKSATYHLYLHKHGLLHFPFEKSADVKKEFISNGKWPTIINLGF